MYLTALTSRHILYYSSHELVYNICDFDHVGFVMVHSYISTFSLRLTQEALMYYICDFDHVHFVMVHSYITTFTL